MVTQLASRKILGINQRAYQCLKLSLSLNLRRQILIAVCDNIVLQNQLAAQLEADLGQPDALTQAILPDRALHLAHLTLDPGQTDFVAQVAQWLQQQPAGQMPCLQILGIEQMTRQSLMAQHHFLQSLEAVESLLPHLNTSLLLWLPWPWLRAIQQSAPQFWRWRSGLFEFVGEPTPVVAIPDGLKDSPEDQRVTNEVVPTSSLYGDSVKVVSATSAEPEAGSATGPVDLWTLLSEDLAQLEAVELLSPEQDSAPSDDDVDNAAVPEASDVSDASASVVVPRLPAQDAESSSAVASEETVDPDAAAAAPVLDFSRVSQPFEALAELKRNQRPPAEIAQAYLALGHHYRSQIEAGAMTPELTSWAIEAYEEGLRWLAEHDPAWGSGLNDLGTLYWIDAQQRPEREQQLEGMTRSLEIYENGLAKIDQQRQAEVASRLHSNVGAVHSTLASYDDPVMHLQQSVEAYRRALPLCAAEQQPEEYATLQNSLGSVYWKLSHYQQDKSASTCLHRAIAAYNEALKSRSPQQAPLDYASVQNNLGIAYWSLSKHERPIFLLKHAIAAYRDALNYRTPHTDPGACASTYNNLGTAYWEIATHLDAEPDPQNRYRQNAIIAYEAALKAAQQGPSNLDLCSIHHCLGNVYDQMAQKSNADKFLPKGLGHYLAALAELERNDPVYEPIFKSLVRNLRSHYDQLGLAGQQAALGRLPGILLPEVMQAI
ncbi:MAG: tetratricopeptide repeat protein [Cyanobacteria bacterium J06632_22]